MLRIRSLREGSVFETAIAPSGAPAAAELDHFSLREKLGLGQSSQKASGAPDGAKHGLNVSKTLPSRSDLAFETAIGMELKPAEIKSKRFADIEGIERVAKTQPLETAERRSMFREWRAMDGPERPSEQDANTAGPGTLAGVRAAAGRLTGRVIATRSVPATK